MTDSNSKMEVFKFECENIESDYHFEMQCNKMLELGFTDIKLNQWKLRLYSNCIVDATKFYWYDEWCHNFFLFGNCKHDKNCQSKHIYNVSSLINEQKFEKAQSFCQYLLYFYEMNQNKKQKWKEKNRKIAWIAHAHWQLAKIYTKSGQSYNDFQIAQNHYLQAIQNHWLKDSVIVDYAHFLENKLKNKNKAESFLNEAIVQCPSAISNFAMAKFLSNQLRFEQSCLYFDKAILLKPNNYIYYYEYGCVLYELGYYQKSHEMFTKALNCNDKTITQAWIDKIGMVIKKAANEANGANGANEKENQLSEMDNNSNDKKIWSNIKNSKNSKNSKNEKLDGYNGNSKEQTRPLSLSSLSVCPASSVNREIDNNTNNTNDNNDNNNNNNNNNDNNKNESKSMIEIEFDRFWDNWPCLPKSKKVYYSKMVSLEYNCINLLRFFDETSLKQDIGMNKLDCLLFLQSIKRWQCERDKFCQWLKNLSLYQEYFVKFEKIGILTFESFYYNIDSYDKLIEILKDSANQSHVEADATLMWQNTPKYKRLSSTYNVNIHLKS